MKRLLTTTVGIAAVALAMTACGAEDPPSSDGGGTDTVTESKDSGGDVADGDFRNAPVPTTDPDDAWEQDLPEEPSRDASLGEQIEYELTSAAAEFSHHYDADASVECPDVKGDKDEDVTCDMTYFGQKIAWDVSISGGSMVARYEYQSDQAVLSREYLENALRFKAEAEDVMCELDAEFTAVNPQEIEPITCHSRKDGTQTVWQLRVGGSGSTTFSER